METTIWTSLIVFLLLLADGFSARHTEVGCDDCCAKWSVQITCSQVSRWMPLKGGLRALYIHIYIHPYIYNIIYIILYYIVLYCIILYYIVLYCIILYYFYIYIYTVFIYIYLFSQVRSPGGYAKWWPGTVKSWPKRPDFDGLAPLDEVGVFSAGNLKNDVDHDASYDYYFCDDYNYDD